MPKEAQVQTQGLVDFYIHDPNTLVLCVLEATNLVSNSHALRLLQDADKLGSTIIALTKSDKVHEDDIEHNVFRRILLTFEDDTKSLEGLKGCVAVVNRKHQDNGLTLQQAADKEINVFAKMLHEAEGQFKVSAMQQQLASAMTSKQLMVRLNKMYHAHITGKWVNETLATLSIEQGKVKKSLDGLGKAPELLIGAQVLASLYSKVGEICSLHCVLKQKV